jgi:hypothetical protein
MSEETPASRAAVSEGAMASGMDLWVPGFGPAIKPSAVILRGSPP